LLFRFHFLLESQAQACRDIALAIQLGNEYSHTDQSILALAEVQNSLAYLEEQKQGHWKRLLMQLTYLFNNLATVEKQLSNINNPDAERLEEDVLDDTNPHTLKAMWQRISANLHKDSMLFRHALRMSIALTAGYGIIQAFDIDRGYWILLNHFIRMPTELQCHSPKIDGASNRYISWFVDWCTIADFFPFSRKPVSIYRYLWCDVFRLPDEQLWVRDWFYYTARPLLI